MQLILYEASLVIFPKRISWCVALFSFRQIQSFEIDDEVYTIQANSF